MWQLLQFILLFAGPVNVNVYSIQLLTGFKDNSSFVWPEDKSVAWSRRLRATDPFLGQTKVLLFEKPVYKCFVIHLHFFQNFLIQSFHWVNNRSIKCFQYPRPSSSGIWTTPRHCDVNIMWLIEPMKIRSSVNNMIASNRSMNCWLSIEQYILLFTGPVNVATCPWSICFCNIRPPQSHALPRTWIQSTLPVTLKILTVSNFSCRYTLMRNFTIPINYLFCKLFDGN